jgi:hypothetical protein
VEPALITGIVALLAAGLSGGIALGERRDRKRQFSKAEEQWRKEREIEHLGRLVGRRFESYPDVMKTLGAVPDVPDVAGRLYQELERDRSSLLPVADELLEHLYGAPGLLMRYETRNQLLRACTVCHRFGSNSSTLADACVRISRLPMWRRGRRSSTQLAARGNGSQTPETYAKTGRSLRGGMPSCESGSSGQQQVLLLRTGRAPQAVPKAQRSRGQRTRRGREPAPGTPTRHRSRSQSAHPRMTCRWSPAMRTHLPGPRHGRRGALSSRCPALPCPAGAREHHRNTVLPNARKLRRLAPSPSDRNPPQRGTIP